MLFYTGKHRDIHSLLDELGVGPFTLVRLALDVYASVRALIPVICLFLGPIVASSSMELTFDFSWTSFKLTPIWMRNYVVGPVTEEFVYRACCITALEWGGISQSACVWYSPLLFGAAHLHHAYGRYRMSVANITTDIVSTTLMQFTYTTVFGWYAAYLYINSHRLIVPVLVHVFCNAMGLPDFHDHLIDQGLHQSRTLLKATTIRASYLVGAYLFYLYGFY